MSSVKIDGKAVRAFREAKDLTQLYIATVVGVTTDTISRWENKKYPAIKFENAQKLAEALDVPLESILEQPQDEKKPVPSAAAGKDSKGEEKRSFLDVPQVFRFGILVLLILLLTGGAGFYWFYLNQEVHITASRSLPPHTAPHLPFPVIIRLQADASIDAPILLRETIVGQARAVAIKAASAPGVKEYGQQPRWIGRLRQGEAAFMYMVHPDPAAEKGESLRFSGDCVSGKVKKRGTSIVGDDAVRITAYHWADNDRDFVITDEEILEAYESYSLPGTVPVDFTGVENLWLAGGYRWDEERQQFIPDSGRTTQRGEQ